MIENIKTMLGEAVNNFTDAQIMLCYKRATAEIEAYCKRELDAELESLAEDMAIIKLNRLNTEGLTSQSFSGTNESYIDGYPAHIQAILNRKRKIKLI